MKDADSRQGLVIARKQKLAPDLASRSICSSFSVGVFALAAALIYAEATIGPGAPLNPAAAALGSHQIQLTWSAPTNGVLATGYLLERASAAALTNFLSVATLSVFGLSGPLVVSQANPRYFANPQGRILLLGGSHHWLNLVDSGTVSPPPVFDYETYLNFLSTNHHNFFRLWTASLPKMDYTIQDAGPWYHSPQPWLRTGPGIATDGLPMFDLTQFNPTYFDRLRQRVRQAATRGIYVSVMLFDAYHVQFDRRSDDGYPLSGANNVNGVDDGAGTRSQDLSVIPMAVLAAEEAYVKHVIDTVNDLPNVLYEIANEGGSYSVTWQQHFLDYVRNSETSKAQQHPVGLSYQYSGGTDMTLYVSTADWVSPAQRFPFNDGSRHVLQNDTDHSYYWTDMKADGAQLNRAFVWQNFTAGNSALFMDPYLMPWTSGGNVRNAPGGCVTGPGCTTLDPLWDPIRKNIGYMLDYANTKLDLGKATPQGSLSSTGWCLANAAALNAEYLIYAPSGGSFTVNLSATTQTLAVEWLNPLTGALTSGGAVNGGSSQTFNAPFSEDAVLYLVDAAKEPIQAQVAYRDTDLNPGTAYCYRLRATDAAGNLSPYSEVTCATTQDGSINAPRITSLIVGQATTTITISGTPGFTYALQASIDKLNWTLVGSEQNTSGSLIFTEQQTTNSIRFYRAVCLSCQ